MPVICNIFNVEVPVQIMGMKDSRVMSVEFNGLEVEPLTHAFMKCRGHLDPSAVNIELIIAVKGKEVCLHHVPQF